MVRFKYSASSEEVREICVQEDAGEHGRAPGAHGRARGGPERMRIDHAGPVHESVRAGAAGHEPGVHVAVERPLRHAAATVLEWHGREDGGH